ncbi:hypothetical protein [Bifidobacterium rousetti]|uniref:hypothetical protein n=1 Tax=Bifidobacterium rousetti TaxID=2045439 RepID=UPI00123965E9|nr:hypothetical protein [Bifidobacterium rousetti]
MTRIHLSIIYDIYPEERNAMTHLNKKIIVLVYIAIFLSFGGTNTAYADNPAENHIDISQPLTPTASTGINSMSLPTQEWSIPSKGRYKFSGWGETSYMHTNYLFTGKSSYYVWANNTGSVGITVRARKRSILLGDSDLKTVSIRPGDSYGFWVTGRATGDKIYLRFYRTQNDRYSFDGYIE